VVVVVVVDTLVVADVVVEVVVEVAVEVVVDVAVEVVVEVMVEVVVDTVCRSLTEYKLTASAAEESKIRTTRIATGCLCICVNELIRDFQLFKSESEEMLLISLHSFGKASPVPAH
jgi:hypothetical protein